MSTNEEQLLSRITVIPGLMAGKPTIRGIRFTVVDILEMLASGMQSKDILEQHPILEPDDIPAALLYASISVGNTRILHAA